MRANNDLDRKILYCPVNDKLNLKPKFRTMIRRMYNIFGQGILAVPSNAKGQYRNQ